MVINLNDLKSFRVEFYNHNINVWASIVILATDKDHAAKSVEELGYKPIGVYAEDEHNYQGGNM